MSDLVSRLSWWAQAVIISFDVASFTFAAFFEPLSPSTKSLVFILPCCAVPSLFAAGRHDCSLRSLDQPWSVDGLSQDLQLEVLEGNRIAKATVDMLTMCLRYRIPVSLENPKTSETDELCNFGRTIDFHICAFGSPWRKYTRLLFRPCEYLT